MMSARFRIVRWGLVTALFTAWAVFNASQACAQQGIFLTGLGESAQNRDVTEDGTNPPGTEATGQAAVAITCCDPMGNPITAQHGTEGEAVQNIVNDLVFFDGTPPNFTKWNDLQGDLFMIPVEITLSQPRTVRYYTVTSANDSPERDPWEWRLLGTNVTNPVPTDFTLIDTRTEIDFPLRHQTQLFGPVTNNTAYRTYRFEFETQYVAQGAANYTGGTIPNSIQAAEVELFEDFAGGGAKLTIDRGSATTPSNITLTNAGTSPITIVGYSITSAAGALNSTVWTSITDTYDGDSGGATPLDTDTWIELTETNGRRDLSEVENLNGAQNGLTLAPAQSINLGNNAWIKYPTEDVTASILLADGTESSVAVAYAGGAQYRFGDLNFDRGASATPPGALTSLDWQAFKAGQGFNFATVFSPAESYAKGDLEGDFDHDLEFYALFRAAYDAANGAGAFNQMLASVPEPNTALLLGLAIAAAVSTRLRRRGVMFALLGLSLTLAGGPVANAQQEIPNLLGNDFTDPVSGITITAGTDPANPSPAAEMPPMAVDNNRATKWLAFLPNGTFYQVQFNGGAQRAVNAYTISSANDAPERDPFAWTLQGSNDGTTFTTIDTRTGQDFIDRFETRIYQFSNDTPYNSYRFNFQTEIGAGAPGAPATNSIQLSEIELFHFGDPLTLEVNRANGAIRMVNNDQNDTIPIDAYRIRSAAGSLNRNAWWGAGAAAGKNGGQSIHDQNPSPTGFPSGIGTGNGWEEGPGSSDNELVEWFLGSGTSAGQGSSNMASNFAITMNGVFRTGGAEDLTFDYRTGGRTMTGVVSYIGGTVGIPGDYNNDGRVDAADYVVWRKTNGTQSGYDTWRTNFGRTSGSGSGSASAVPEPGTWVVAMCVPALLVVVRRRQFTNLAYRDRLANSSAPVSRSCAMTRIFFGATRAAMGLALGLACLFSSLPAATTIDRNYQLGDDAQENAVVGQTVGQSSVVANHTLDSASQGSFFDLPQTGGPTYANVGPTGSARPGAAANQKGVQFTGSSSQYLGGSAGFGSPQEGGALANPQITNYSRSRFMQIWARPTLDTGARQDVVNDTFQFGVHITPGDTWGHTYGGAGGVGTARDTGAPVAYNQWTHIMQQTFSNGGVAVYVNGVAVSRINAAYALTTGAADNRNIYVGTNLGATGGFFTGQLDNLKIGVYGVFVPQNPPIPVDWGTFNLGTDNDFIATRNLVAGDVNGDGVVNGNGSGQAATDDVRFFVDHWLDERRVNNIIIGDLTSRTTMGDLNFDGRTTLADWAILRTAHVGGASLDLAALLGGGGVPEPSTFALISITAMSMVGLTRRRRGV